MVCNCRRDRRGSNGPVPKHSSPIAINGIYLWAVTHNLQVEFSTQLSIHFVYGLLGQSGQIPVPQFFLYKGKTFL